MIIEKLTNLHDLSPVEEKLVSCILKNGEAVCSMSVQRLAEASFTSPATVMRYIKKWGFDSYTDFKLLLKEELVKIEEHGRIDNFDFPFSNDLSYKDLAKQLALLTTQAISSTLSMIDYRVINRIVQLVRNIAAIDIYGQGSSQATAYEFKNKLLRLGKIVHLENGFSEQLSQAASSTDSHLAIIISHSGMNEETLRVARVLQTTRTAILAITHKPENPLSKLATYNLYTYVDETDSLLNKMETYGSHISTQYLLDYLYTAIFLFDFSHNMDTIKKREKEIRASKTVNCG